MRKLGRWIFNGLTILSLLLFLATAGVWVRSYWRADVVVIRHGRETSGLLVSRGWYRTQDGFFPRLSAWNQAKGWHYESLPTDAVESPSFGESPFWNPTGLHLSIVALAFLTLPVLALLWRPGLRPEGGYCQRCGYDLRASPQRCPECGMVIEAVVESRRAKPTSPSAEEKSPSL